MAQRFNVVVLGLGELHPAHDRCEDALALKLPVQHIALLPEQKRVGAWGIRHLHQLPEDLKFSATDSICDHNKLAKSCTLPSYDGAWNSCTDARWWKQERDRYQLKGIAININLPLCWSGFCMEYNLLRRKWRAWKPSLHTDEWWIDIGGPQSVKMPDGNWNVRRIKFYCSWISFVPQINQVRILTVGIISLITQSCCLRLLAPNSATINYVAKQVMMTRLPAPSVKLIQMIWSKLCCGFVSNMSAREDNMTIIKTSRLWILSFIESEEREANEKIHHKRDKT